ncbi:hypothetical protein B566_EDAN006734 [Ephemera danica]|nr:hypothetical protein B566_EDAN006734 [Ephemera danica]
MYVIGYTLLTLMAADLLGPLGCNRQKITSCSPHIFSIMVIVGLAVGTVKANIPPFGAEQVRSGGTSSLRVYFNWYYWCINGGSLVGIGALSYIEQDTSGGRGFPVAFAVATGALALALLLILIGRPIFVVHRPISSSLLGSIFHMFREGVTGCCSTRVPISIQGSPILSHHNAARPNLPERSSRPLTTSTEAPMWLDYAKVRYGGSHRDAAVDEVKKLGIVLLLLVSLLPYWLVFLQSDSGFQAQAVHLKVDVDNFRVPTAWLGLMDQVFVLALIPLMNNLIYPLLDRAGYNVSLVTRIGIGMLLSTFAVSVAGGLETISMNDWKNGHRVNQTIANETYAASEVSVLWQIPQYCLVGSAEVFASVGGLELAHALAPRSMQGLVMGLLSAMEGIASFFGMGLIAILSPVWIQPDITHFSGHLDWFFFLLAILQGSMLVLCTVIVWRRRRREALQSNPLT